MNAERTNFSCNSCGRPLARVRRRPGVEVLLCDECFSDRFRCERVFAEAQGKTFNPAMAWPAKE